GDLRRIADVTSGGEAVERQTSVANDDAVITSVTQLRVYNREIRRICAKDTRPILQWTSREPPLISQRSRACGDAEGKSAVQRRARIVRLLRNLRRVGNE